MIHAETLMEENLTEKVCTLSKMPLSHSFLGPFSNSGFKTGGFPILKLGGGNSVHEPHHQFRFFLSGTLSTILVIMVSTISQKAMAYMASLCSRKRHKKRVTALMVAPAAAVLITHHTTSI